MSFNWKATGLFAAGVAFGTAGIKVLSSKDAKKAYTHCTAATLRAKDFVMKTVNTVQENAEDIYAEAKSINEERAAAAEAKAIADAKEEEEKEVYFQQDWIKMIQDHTVNILGWIQYEKVKWLQNNNPEVPGLVYKLTPTEEKDKLRKAAGRCK